MAKIKDPVKRVATLLKETKKLAGGRKITISDKPQPGMPGSGKMAQLKEVEIKASPITKPAPEKPVALLSVSQFGGGSKTYLKDDIIKMLSNVGMNREADGIKGMRTISGDMSDILNKLISKKGIKAVK